MVAASGLLAAGSVIALYAPVLADLAKDWAHDDNYSHGFLIPPIAAYFVWRRRGELFALPRRPSVLGLFVIAASLAVLLVGTIGVELFLTRISLLGVMTGAVIFLCGWRWLRLVALPLAFLVLMIPLPAIVFNQIAFPLQLLATRFGVGVLRLAEIPVLREGNVIVLANMNLEVAEACSGIRSLVTLFSLAIVFGYFADSRPTARVLIALSSVPIAIVANGLRVAGTGLAAYHFGAGVAGGFFHTFSGWLVFVASFGLLAAIAAGLRPFHAGRFAFASQRTS